MQLPAPTSLAEVIADGAIVQADISAGFTAALGEITRVELIRGEDTATEVTITGRKAGTVTFPGSLVAEIREDQWTWLSGTGEDFGIPELQDTGEASEGLIAAARTLHHNTPVILAPDASGRTWVVALEGEFRQQEPRRALITGLAQLPAEVDLRRALLGFAAARGLEVRESPGEITFSEGTTLSLVDGRVAEISGGLPLAQVRADAHFLSAEHQLLFEGTLPQARTTLTPEGATLSSATGATLNVAADIIATVRNDTWTWAWADPTLPESRARELQRFGIDNGIPEFFTPRLPMAQVRSLKLWAAAKPVLHRWVHATTANQGGYAVLLIDTPELHLPPPSFPAVQATLAAELPADLDLDYARQAYARARGLSLRDGQIDIGGQLL
ncbi:DUF6882 domain-containing protein [Corynebacterium sp. A21]|uniref:DUF6882 domain-containing protein n=1 Tax=Corynebacterium sp. A21 TaxID=3457318 RepID=UPI003FD18B59